MRRERARALVMGALCVLGCVPALRPSDAALGPPKGESMAVDSQTHGLSDREHLFYRPVGNPSDLLGRAVKRGPNGEWLIAEERAPGCKVAQRSHPERWKRTYVDDLKSVVAGGADLGEIASLQAKYGSQAQLEVTIQNTELLEADLEGDCGDRLILAVRVGTGARSLRTRIEKAAAGGVTAFGLGAKTAAGQDHDQATLFTWDEPQGWLFTVGSGSGRRRLDLRATMPTELFDGQHYRITVFPNRDVWLVVYYRDEGGQPGKLLPNEENPVIQVAPNERIELPEMTASLADSSRETRETMVICGFDSPDYAREYQPPRGDPSLAEMQDWYKALPDRLNQIERHHYACDPISYRISPAAKNP